MATSAELALIASAGPFQERVRYAMVKQALAEFATAGTNELALIQGVLRGQGPVQTWALAVVAHAGIASGTYNVDGSNISDAAIDTAVQALWPALVG